MYFPSLELDPPPLPEGGGVTHSPACEGAEESHANDWREGLVLCGVSDLFGNVNPVPHQQSHGRPKEKKGAPI